MRAIAALIALAGAGSALGQSAQAVLVVQTDVRTEIVAAARKLAEKQPPKPTSIQQPITIPKFDPDKFAAELVPVALEDVAAQEFDDEGRLTPIAWSMGDPVFRTAVEEKLIPGAGENPSEADIRAAMGKLRAGYLFLIQAYAAEGQVYTQARLFKGQKEIWKDEVRTWQSNIQSQFDEENARRSIVRTWIQILGSGVLKDLTPRRRAVPAPNEPGPIVPAPPTVPTRPAVDNKQVLTDVMKLLAQKEFGEAVNLMRDAVDAEPLDFERRSTLISTLIQAGQPALAADEARRAAMLMPDRIEFWVAAARSWLAADRPDEALKDLNEAVARDPESRSTRLLLGELQLADRKFELALQNLTEALEGAPDAYGLRLRAFVYAAIGDSVRSAADLEAAAKSEAKETDEQQLRRFRLSQSGGLAQSEAVAGELRGLIPQIRLEPKNADLPRALEGLLAKLNGLAAYFAPPPPERHRNSTERLLLALNLLSQSANRLRETLGKTDEDALTDATIDLGEAIKALEAARQARKTESA